MDLGGMPVADPQSVSQGGTYQLVAANNLGCSDTALVQAMVYVAPELGSDLAFTLCPWQTVNFNTLFSATGLNEVWSLNGVSIGSPGITHDPGIYHLTVTDSNSCMDEVSVTIDTVSVYVTLTLPIAENVYRNRYSFHCWPTQ